LFHGQGCALILTRKCIGPHLGRFFSQTHLVTLRDQHSSCHWTPS
jgi:hypothetical protein